MHDNLANSMLLRDVVAPRYLLWLAAHARQGRGDSQSGRDMNHIILYTERSERAVKSFPSMTAER